MIGEVSIGGVFVPTLLVLFFVALLLSGGIVALLGPSGFYRFVVYKALVDLAIFVLILGGLSFLATQFGFRL